MVSKVSGLMVGGFLVPPKLLISGWCPVGALKEARENLFKGPIGQRDLKQY